MNAFLKRLGFAPEERVVIFHADDLGMCHAMNEAFMDIVGQGFLRTGAAMVPCPWFPELAAWARERAGALDLGVHLTLTSEWQKYRWGPISTRDEASGLLDADGYFWRETEAVHAHMNAEAAAAELRAQIERALAAGIDVTHIDTHMGSMLHPELALVYISLAQEYRIPAMIPRLSMEELTALGISQEMAKMFVAMLNTLEESGALPVVDHLRSLEEPTPDNRWEKYAAVLRALPPGLTHLLFHAARPGPEIEAIAGDWPMRVADYEVFASEGVRRLVEETGVKVFSYRALRDLMRAGS
ncbi:MAG: polysaccharide deacetylase family protein [Anaerolineae bacterium]